MNTKTAKNWYETILDSQKKMAESMNETAKKFSSNDQVNQALENGSDFFKKWLDFQMDFVKNTTQNESMKNAGEAATESFSNWKNYYENLFKSQNEAIQQLNNQNMQWFKQWSSMFGQNTWTNPWSQMPGMEAFGNWNHSFQEMYKTMMSNFNGNSNTKEVFEGLFNHTQSFMKFYELWHPVMEAMQKSGFNADSLKNLLKPEAYKEFMDSFFGFMPAGVKDFYTDGMNKWNEQMQQFGKQGTDMYRNFSQQWQQYMPQGNSFFTEALNNYNQMYNQMQGAVAPFARLITPNAFTQQAENISTMLDMMNRYQILNSQMQYMTYLTGMKAMEEMGTLMASRAAEGKQYENMQQLFKEWLETSDKFFVELFESETFSKVQAETSSLSLRIKGAMDNQMEKMFANVPVVPRSEMDELYKTVYELKKRVRTLEKELENSTVEEPKTAPKAAARKSSK